MKFNLHFLTEFGSFPVLKIRLWACFSILPSVTTKIFWTEEEKQLTDVSCQAISCDGFISMPGKHGLPKGELENHAHKVSPSLVALLNRRMNRVRLKPRTAQCFH